MSNIQLIQGNCLEKLKELDDNSVDSIVTDPPYGLSFMGKKWDYDVPTTELWEEALRVLKPGGHLLAFFGTRTYHRGVVRIEDAGFEIRDMVSWVYASGFPKSHNIAKSIDKMDVQSDLAKQHEGWGTALKPAVEPIVVARKPLSEKTVAKNVLKWGTGGINIDDCRVAGEMGKDRALSTPRRTDNTKYGKANETINPQSPLGRFPANFIHDGSDEVVGLFPRAKGCTHSSKGTGNNIPSKNVGMGGGQINATYGDDGSAARFFYCAKASNSERNAGLEGSPTKNASELTGRKKGSKGLSGSKEHGNSTNPFSNGGSVLPRANFHPTVKPIKLMQYLCRLVTPKGGTVLDPFMGSGSTGIASKKEGFNFIGIELDQEYYEIAKSRIEKSL